MRRVLLGAAAVAACSLVACDLDGLTPWTGGGDGGGDVDPGNTGGTIDISQTLRLPLRVHLLRSEHAELNNTLSQRALLTYLQEANAIFAPAGVVWQVEDVVEEDAEHDAGVSGLLNGGDALSAEDLASVAPQNNQLHPQGFDAYIAGDLTAFGVASAFVCETPGVFAGRYRGDADSDARRPIQAEHVARSLARSLGLPWVYCSERNAANLMLRDSCVHAVAERHLLTMDQLQLLRDRARAGVARDCD